MATIYQPVNMEPKNIAKDATDTITFTWETQGSPQTDFQLYAYDNDTDVLMIDTGKITSADETYSATPNTLTNGNDYKWKLDVYNGTSMATSELEFFSANAVPAVTFTDPLFSATPLPTIDSQNYTFKCDYAQDQDVAIKRFKFNLYDSTGTIVVDTSDWVYDFTVEYEFTGMVNNTTYQVECLVESQNDQAGQTSKETFLISYTLPDSSQNITLTENDDNASITISWADLKQVLGTIDGNFSYVDGKFNQGIHIESSTPLEYSETFDDTEFTFTGWFKLTYGHDGDFATIGTKNIGYENSTKRFYVDEAGVKNYTNQVTLYTWDDFGSSSWLPYVGQTWLTMDFVSTDFQYNWYFFGFTADWLIIKTNFTVIASVST